MEAEERAAEAVDKMTESQPAQEATVVVETVEPKKTGLPEIRMSDGLFVPQSLTEATRIADGLLKSGCIPKQYNSIPKVLMGMQFLRQLGLPDIAGLPKLAIINGSYSLWGEGPKAVCQSEIQDFDEFFFDKDYNRICFQNKNLHAEVYGALCRVTRKGIPTSVERVFTTDDAKRAGLLGKSGPWQDYRSRMLQMRARGWALKDAFPDKLLGVGIAEYDHNVLIENIHSEPARQLTAADEINKTYSGETTKQPGAA